MSEPDPKGAELVAAIVSEISAMQLTGDIRAIACVMIRDDDDVRTLIAHGNHTRIPLLGGVVLLQTDLVDRMRLNRDGDDIDPTVRP